MAFLYAALAVLLGAVATTRLTRLVVADEITYPIRLWVASHTKEPEFYPSGAQVPHTGSKITYLIHCAWCSGLWVGLAVAVALWFGGLAALLDPLAWWVAIPVLTLSFGHAAGKWNGKG